MDAVLRQVAAGYTESVVGPLLFFTLAGVPGAMTYQTSRLLRDRWTEKRPSADPLARAAERAFAVVNFVPSFVSGVLLSWSARWTEKRGHEAWAAAQRENERHGWMDPNWPSGALAGALGRPKSEMPPARTGLSTPRAAPPAGPT